MKIEHIGLWVTNLENMRVFYETYFKATASKLYHNKKTSFHSYFLTFSDGARLEIMQRDDIVNRTTSEEILGFAHLAISLGSKTNVDNLTNILVMEGYELLSPTRTTGDGYYESVIADPEGNRLELTV
ncbi:VOC family protein [Candidatus Enterococcus ikei]|uniref:VOC family protein n=1 Tax=Candidatus Enterococcus ikei TaxID=2815326 RepID=A0ABS3GYX7_9ENTE|nr:VOC family protein [Enterococcus sp. DIV0869a]MBO0439659.1 VOC family protein [Enterococcus sp. DIV0869a]